jgi:hypothetical protein
MNDVITKAKLANQLLLLIVSLQKPILCRQQDSTQVFEQFVNISVIDAMNHRHVDEHNASRNGAHTGSNIHRSSSLPVKIVQVF